MSQHQLLRLPQVIALTGLSRSTIYLYIRQEKFPEPIKLGERAVAWREDEIKLWISRKIVKSNRKPFNSLIGV